MNVKLSIALLATSLCVMAYAEESSNDSLSLSQFKLDEVVVQAHRKVFLQQAEYMSGKELELKNTGQNLPVLLSATPAFVSTSDDGLGVGYTYFRIRGTEHTRINMTVNDVPLNDAESQAVFWVNLTDMVSGLGSVNIQRGVGTSVNGSSAFGASINMETVDRPDLMGYNTHKAGHSFGGAVSFNGGMYNTFREMVYLHAELGRWHIGGRFSKVNSDGYLERAKSDLLSYQANISYRTKNNRTALDLLCFGGKEKTYMAWYGVTENDILRNRRFNPAGLYYDINGDTAYYANQTDNYAQQHVQFHLRHKFNNHWHLAATAHYTHGAGHYMMADYAVLTPVNELDSILKKAMNNHFFGAIINARYIHEKVDVQFGFAINDYIGRHIGTYLRTDNSIENCYLGRGNKIDGNIYAKANWRVLQRADEMLTLYGDLQYRLVHYVISGDNDETYLPIYVNKTYHFFNPKAGLTYDNRGHRLSASLAVANREPARMNFTGAVIGIEPKAERLYDAELAYIYAQRDVYAKITDWSLGINLYMMNYRDQLIPTGELNAVGAAVTRNVRYSYRTGAEFVFHVDWTRWFTWSGNLSWSSNKWLDSAGKFKTISFSPDWVMANVFRFHIAGFEADIQTNVVSKQYLDNTEDRTAVLKPYSFTNLMLAYQLPVGSYGKRPDSHWPDIRIHCLLNNVFDTKYNSNGGASGGYVWYYPQAGINVHAGVSLQW